MKKKVSVTLVRDMRKERKWVLQEHAPRRLISVADMEVVPILWKGEKYIFGEDLVWRAEKSRPNCGQEDAEWLLEHQDKIPEEFRKFRLFFPDTVWVPNGIDSYMPCLKWSGDRWCLDFVWVDDSPAGSGSWGGSEIGRDDRLVRKRNN